MGGDILFTNGTTIEKKKGVSIEAIFHMASTLF